MTVNPRLLGLLLVAAMVSPAPTRACVTTVIPTNQELFRRAALIYEATAVASDFSFEVNRVLRGTARGAIRLDWFKETPCDTFGAPRLGESYLAFIFCATPSGGDVFSCRSWIEPLEGAARRMEYLRSAEPLPPWELADRLESWLEGDETTEELAGWVARMKDLAEISDWQEMDGDEWSLTLGTLLELDSQLNERGVPLGELECEISHLKSNAVPFNILLLDREDITDQDLETLEEAYSESESSCF